MSCPICTAGAEGARRGWKRGPLHAKRGGGREATGERGRLGNGQAGAPRALPRRRGGGMGA
eukprot:365199-Chlamydomonas_euryale.AAC.11